MGECNLSLGSVREDFASVGSTGPVSHRRTTIGLTTRSCEKGCVSFHVVLTF